MVDIVDAATRSRMMSGVRGKNTKPEISVRKALHARGFRYRIHVNNLPGKPDLVLPKYSAVVFVHGCFWHGHSCPYFKIPQTRTDFWCEKIRRNRARDKVQESSLLAGGWRILVIWECAVRSMNKEKSHVLIDQVAEWLINGNEYLQIDETKCSPTPLVTISKA
ncbi:very short patch repair endonuclease [Pseudomonas sp. Sample_9]|uniref:very short patch repair endonuclease n=1 Tax=Pseudomonas sp. Sample_9 TaxID=2382158 RepID=UPI001032C629|nr:very short patch repair endonuclease [Pseudomonas sp. Sample_9]